MKVIALMTCHARVPYVLYSRQWLAAILANIDSKSHPRPHLQGGKESDEEVVKTMTTSVSLIYFSRLLLCVSFGALAST